LFDQKKESQMKAMNVVQVILSIVTILIGIFMIVKFAGSALAPLLSGIAFVVIGIALLLMRK